MSCFLGVGGPEPLVAALHRAGSVRVLSLLVGRELAVLPGVQ